MKQALIGHTGFVGSNLARSEAFDATYNSTNIETIRGRHFHRLVCAGVPAVKWWANQHPAEDRATIARLTTALSAVAADSFILISTIDVYPRPVAVDETVMPVAADAVEAYGRHRLELEQFVANHFPTTHIIRLPALFGRGLKKNALFDLMNDNRLAWVHPDSRFQWYPLARLATDLQHVERHGVALANFATEPVTMREIQQRYFPGKRLGGEVDRAALYDFRTRYGALWGRPDGYCLGQAEVLDAMGRYLGGIEV